MKTQTNSVLSMVRRLTLLFFATALIAINVRTFVQAGGLIPGGFTGLVLLAQELALRYFGIHIPFSLLLYAMNAVPAFFCFRYVGKKFTILSLFSVILCGLMIDFMPAMFINFLSTYDILLSAVFGGLLNAVAVAIALSVGATLGGTDFIAIYISEKYRKDAWNYILREIASFLSLRVLFFRLTGRFIRLFSSSRQLWR
jgi:uncharacterized membrane-anchored protein YitT (DUF2179 family)